MLRAPLVLIMKTMMTTMRSPTGRGLSGSRDALLARKKILNQPPTALSVNITTKLGFQFLRSWERQPGNIVLTFWVGLALRS